MAKSLADAANSGSKREQLEALRAILAEAIDGCDSLRDLAALSNRYTQVLDELEKLDQKTEDPTVADAVAQTTSSRAK